MPSYIALGTFTDQGARTVKDTTKRADAVRDMAGRFGVTIKSIHWTLGQYDVVTFCEATDEASATAFGLALASAGNVRTETLRAFSKDEMAAILAKLP
ncbi:MAG TPA: GYD domain-containing protein [Ramlibacter sp.]|nr:GYD domain-containing protein [Ramlibacter sp.]